MRKESQQLYSELASLPNGSFFCVKDKSRVKWFVTDKTGTHYLPKSNLPLAEKLAYKKYLSAKLKEINSELKALQSYLKYHNPNYGHADQMLDPESIYSPLLSPYFIPRISSIKDFEQWSRAPYETNPAHPENLIQPTNLGFSVRSKSEAFIAAALHANGIPFRYECALSLDGITVYPDFTILHPISGKILYWEHFGMIDKVPYQANYISKIKLYITNGIYPSINLITSYETEQNPFTLKALDEILISYDLKKD